MIAPREGVRLDATRMRDALRDQLGGYKLPRAIAVCSPGELPVGPSGKVLRRTARATFTVRLVCVDE